MTRRYRTVRNYRTVKRSGVTPNPLPGFCVCLLCEMEGKPRFQVPATSFGRQWMKRHLMEMHNAEDQ